MLGARADLAKPMITCKPTNDCYDQFQRICLNFLQLDLALKDEKGGDISSFITNGEWDLIGKQHNKKNLDQGR